MSHLLPGSVEFPQYVISWLISKQLLHPKGELGKELNIVPERARRHMVSMHFDWIGEFAWAHDWKVLSRPSIRIDRWALLSANVYTAARVSDYIESSARLNSGIGLHYKVCLDDLLTSPF